MLKNKKKCHAYVSKYTTNREKREKVPKVPKREEWHYLTVKKLSTLIGITSKHKGDFYCLNCLHSFRTKTRLNHIKKYVKIQIL